MVKKLVWPGTLCDYRFTEIHKRNWGSTKDAAISNLDFDVSSDSKRKMNICQERLRWIILYK